MSYQECINKQEHTEEPVGGQDEVVSPEEILGPNVPIVSLSHNELQQAPRLEVGDRIACPWCGTSHPLQPSIGTDGQPCGELLFYQCGPRFYLAAVDGHSLMERFRPSLCPSVPAEAAEFSLS